MHALDAGERKHEFQPSLLGSIPGHVAEFKRRWPESDRYCFFLRQDVIKQLSVDTMIWASVLGRCRLSQDLSGLAPSSRCGMTYRLFNIILHRVWSSEAKPYWMITVASDLGACCRDTEREDWQARAHDIRPSVRDKILGTFGLRHGMNGCSVV